jgi:hypothetical protein
VVRQEAGVLRPSEVVNKLHKLLAAEWEVAELGRVEVWGCIELEGVESAEVELLVQDCMAVVRLVEDTEHMLAAEMVLSRRSKRQP